MRSRSAVSLTLTRFTCSLLLFSGATVTAQQNPSSSPASGAVQQEALRILNDSDWAHTVYPTIQNTPCTYQNAAFPGLLPEDTAAEADAIIPPSPKDAVKPDNSEYLIRFQAAKPVQTATHELLAMGEKWSAYGREPPVSAADGPTDLSKSRYNVADMITIAVILKHPDSDGASLLDYAFQDHGRIFPSHSFLVFPCAGLKTSDGQVFAHLVPTGWRHRNFRAIQLSFPRLLDGKPLISKQHEKVEFRMVANQRVFETTFYINASDVLDGSEKSLFLPFAFTDLTASQVSQQ